MGKEHLPPPEILWSVLCIGSYSQTLSRPIIYVLFFYNFWRVGVVNLVVSVCVLRATSKKGSQLFWEKKVHPRENPSYAYEFV